VAGPGIEPGVEPPPSDFAVRPGLPIPNGGAPKRADVPQAKPGIPGKAAESPEEIVSQPSETATPPEARFQNIPHPALSPQAGRREQDFEAALKAEDKAAETRVPNLRTPEPSAPETRAVFDAPRYRVLGQVGAKYLAVEGPDGLLLVDPHALHERWNYERLRGRAGPPARTRLLLPVVVDFPPAQAAMTETAIEPLRDAGFEVEPFGGGALSVSAAPEFLRLGDITRLVRDAVLESGRAGLEVERRRDQMFASLACRSAVLFGRRLADEEVVAVLELLASLGQAPTCPHGRPATLLLSWAELTRRFGR